MRYIRTKDKIYELKENDATQTPEEVQIALITGNYKQADTIEELIDNYVFIEKGKMPIDIDKETITFNVGVCLKDKTVVYGAIWTDKGLIYVAKMDSEGKLVLI